MFKSPRIFRQDVFEQQVKEARQMLDAARRLPPPSPPPFTAKTRVLREGEVFLLHAEHSSGASVGGNAYYPHQEIPILPTLGRFVLKGFAGSDVLFDPWPSPWDFASDGHPGLVGWEWCSDIPEDQARHAVDWLVIATMHSDVAFDHGRTSGKCRFGAGEVLYRGDKASAVAIIDQHRPVFDYELPSNLEIAEAYFATNEPLISVSYPDKWGSGERAEVLKANGYI